MLRIRLSRVGKKGQPYYRVVVADSESKRDGRIVENIGHYNTLVKPSAFVVKEDRVLYWLSVGAQPSDTVRNFLEKRGTMKRLARLKAGEPLEALVAEVEGPKETPRAEPKKAAPARAGAGSGRGDGSHGATVAEAEPAVEEPVVKNRPARPSRSWRWKLEQPSPRRGRSRCVGWNPSEPEEGEGFLDRAGTPSRMRLRPLAGPPPALWTPSAMPSRRSSRTKKNKLTAAHSRQKAGHDERAGRVHRQIAG